MEKTVFNTAKAIAERATAYAESICSTMEGAEPVIILARSEVRAALAEAHAAGATGRTDYETFVDILTARSPLASASMSSRPGDKNSITPLYNDQTKEITITDGYCGFYTDFKFDEDGKLVSVSAWE